MKNKVTAIALAALLLTCGGSLQAQTTTLRYGQIPSTMKSVSALHFNIAQRKGLFAREGVNIDMIAIDGGAANMMAALDRGAVDITRTASFFLIEAALKGSEGELDLKGLGQVIQFMAETGDLKAPLPAAERFVDLQYLRAAGTQ